MEFSLVYRGPLKPNGSPKEKQAIRRQLHEQLAVLWDQSPLVHQRERWIEKTPMGSLVQTTNIVRRLGPFMFVPLVCQSLHLICEIDVTFLRPEAPGFILTTGGDIDNRLKTLFDAFRMPRVDQEIARDDAPQPGEDPFFCLLEDDNLVSRISVTTDRLLDRKAKKGEAHLIMRVRIKRVVGTWDNLALG